MFEKHYEEIPLTIANLYSELHHLILARKASQSEGEINGSFVKKKIKNKIYWYLQHSENGQVKQNYLGPDSVEIKKFIKNHKQDKKNKKDDVIIAKKIVEALKASGGLLFSHINLKIIQLFSESGFFERGAVLVGTNAFLAYGAPFGVKWLTSTQTQDIDIAQNEDIDLALPQVDSKIGVYDVLTQAKLGFHPIPSLNLKHPSTSFKMRGKETRVDLLTPLIGKPSSEPVYIKSLKAAAYPLRYLDLLIEDPIQVVIPYDYGLLVNVPHPVRFAFHKFLISTLRPVHEKIKSQKDIVQSKSISDVLKKDKMFEINTVLNQISKYSPKISKSVAKFKEKILGI